METTRPFRHIPSEQLESSGSGAGVVFESDRERKISRARRILSAVFQAADIEFNGNRSWDIEVHDERFFPRVFTGGSLAFGESYMDGWWDCDELDEMVHRLLKSRAVSRLPVSPSTALAWVTSHLVNLQTKRRSRSVGRRHYDLGNDFFEAMLDPAMQYSCAFFKDTEDLAAAQRMKMDLICRKLDLEPGMRLLDIGCGWGGLARYAAQNFGCHVTGITISREQESWAREHCEGLPVEIRLQDFRDLSGKFDRVVSVGMVEHVGFKNYRRYMETVSRCLEKGGLFLCHTITANRSRRFADPWITRYIFPNSMLPSTAQLARASEGLFVLEDVHGFGEFYDPTLCAWHENVRRAWPRFRDHFGERFLRMWRYYLLSCAGAFRARDMQVYQFVFSKDGVPGGYRSVRV
jgi:cyclopropane-fatty-acyl-phospholipid synthase